MRTAQLLQELGTLEMALGDHRSAVASLDEALAVPVGRRGGERWSRLEARLNEIGAGDRVYLTAPSGFELYTAWLVRR